MDKGRQFNRLGELLRANDQLNTSALTSPPQDVDNTLKKFKSNTAENFREYDTRAAVLEPEFNNVKVLAERAKAGRPTEISGDAMARAKAGQTPKYHRNV